jgi:hypothetical protein
MGSSLPVQPTAPPPGIRAAQGDPSLQAMADPEPAPPVGRGPFEFRFLVNFRPQLSTPCTRCFEPAPQGARPLFRAMPRTFQRHLV